jgi:hypothetical protein
MRLMLDWMRNALTANPGLSYTSATAATEYQMHQHVEAPPPSSSDTPGPGEGNETSPSAPPADPKQELEALQAEKRALQRLLLETKRSAHASPSELDEETRARYSRYKVGGDARGCRLWGHVMLLGSYRMAGR